MATKAKTEAHDQAEMSEAAPAPAAEVRTLCGMNVETAATVGVVAIGAAIIEVALIPGMILGVAAVVAPKVLPRMGEAFQPMFKATVRGAYHAGRKAHHIFAEAQEHVHDAVAEAKAEATGTQTQA